MDVPALSEDVLIHLRRTDAATPAGTVGLAIAGRLGAWATGLHVVPIAAAAFASPEAVAMCVHESDAVYRAALESGGFWEGELARHGVRGEWSVAQGDTVEALCHASRWCGMVVVERPQLNPDAPTGWGVVSRTVFGAAAPVVVVPETLRCEEIATRIVVAWNHSREAMLAIRGAIPLLRRAEAVTVLEGDPGENALGLRWLPRIDLGAWLLRHGVRATHEPFTASREHGAALLDIAHRRDANLLVTGAWGHSRITELVLGGATRHLFQNADLPLFVAH